MKKQFILIEHVLCLKKTKLNDSNYSYNTGKFFMKYTYSVNKNILTIIILIICLILTDSSCYYEWYKRYGIQSKDDLFKASSVPSLINALDGDYEIQIKSIEALGKIGHGAKDSLPFLIKKLPYKNNNKWKKIEEAIIKISYNNPEALPYLIKALNNEKAYNIIENTLKTIIPDNSMITLLIKSLNTDNLKDRKCIIDLVRKIKISTQDYVLELIQEINNENNNIRQFAVLELGIIGADAKKSVPFLMKALKDKKLFIRASAVESLGKIGHHAKNSIPSLLQLIANDSIHNYNYGEITSHDYYNRINNNHGKVNTEIVINALCNIANKDSLTILIDALSDNNSNIRSAGALILGCMGGEATDAVPFLFLSIDDPDFRVIVRAIEALGSISQSTTKPLSVNGITDRKILKKLEVLSLATDNNPIHINNQIVVAAQNTIRKIKIKDMKRETKILSKIDNIPPTLTITSKGTNNRAIKVVLTKMEKFTVTGIAKDESGIANVFINGIVADLDRFGNFSADVYLQVGNNPIQVVAIDIHRNTSFKTFTISRLQSKKIKPPVSKDKFFNITGDYRSLIIGINDYTYLIKLKTAVNDSIAIQEILKEYGFTTVTLIDNEASRIKIMKEINKFRNRLMPEDKLLIYYAGHGFYNQKTEKAYWLPVDAEMNDTTNWIIADTITSSIKGISAKQILIVSDSCYSGTLTRNIKIDSLSKSTRFNYIKKILDKKSRVLIASGGNEPVADNSSKGSHSVFATAFITALNNIDKEIFTAEEIFVNHIKEYVAGNALQTPEYRLIRNSGHSGGDFIFIRQKNKVPEL
ncbi:Peptidase C14, caspase catalytic domain protein [Candidatus Magnetomorum sp. HK-1]|nr:Peptidase C14, caspase catalytic domain protein [Candidatus Magnetomorum sp. HK-1]